MHIVRILCLTALFLLSGCAAKAPRFAPGEIPRAAPPREGEAQKARSLVTALAQKYPIDYRNPEFPRLERIVNRLTEAAGADRYPWNIYILRDDKTANAAATMGNYVFVWTGLLNKLSDDNQLAVVLAHEVSHVLCDHTRSDPALVMKKGIAEVGSNLAKSAANQAGSGYGLLASIITNVALDATLVKPEEKRQELEADQVGLFLMARAGYDPRAAAYFWEKSLSDPDFNQGVPQFLSTHPSSADRLTRIKSMLPAAYTVFQGQAEKQDYRR